MADAYLLILENVAIKLGDLVEKVAFVGGATLGLHITDPGAATVRPTNDVDVIAEIATYMEYFDFSERLKERGFKEDSGERPLNCRWLHGDLVLDVMPVENGILLGSVNRWYKDGLKFAKKVGLGNGLWIRSVTAPYFLGTKVEAFHGRGNRDYYASRDLEDYIAVIDGRVNIVEEVALSAPDLRDYLAEASQQLLSESRFIDALPGYLLPDEGSQQRLQILLSKLTGISRA